uniref:hypothetical protein n=1 Tax=Stenotrophomonas maltophilia TaxID=40324 RepID=UPI0013DAF98C
EYTLIPHGLHVVGRAPSAAERVELLMACAQATQGRRPERAVIEDLVAHGMPASDDDLEDLVLLQQLSEMDQHLAEDREIEG